MWSLKQGTLLSATYIKCSQKCFGGDFLVEKLTTSCGHVELCDLCIVHTAATRNGNYVRATFWWCLTVNNLQIANTGVHILGILELFWGFHLLHRSLPITLSINYPYAFREWFICRILFNVSHMAFSTIDHSVLYIYICSKLTFFHSKFIRKITSTIDIFILCSC